MIETISAVAISITTIIVSSLIFANSQIKKQRRWELEDFERLNPSLKEEEKEKEDLEILPHLQIYTEVLCPKCSVRTTTNDYGLRPATACSNNECKYNSPHLHCSCRTCKSEWAMRPADYKETNEPIA